MRHTKAAPHYCARASAAHFPTILISINRNPKGLHEALWRSLEYICIILDNSVLKPTATHLLSFLVKSWFNPAAKNDLQASRLRIEKGLLPLSAQKLASMVAMGGGPDIPSRDRASKEKELVLCTLPWPEEMAARGIQALKEAFDDVEVKYFPSTFENGIAAPMEIPKSE